MLLYALDARINAAHCTRLAMLNVCICVKSVPVMPTDWWWLCCQSYGPPSPTVVLYVLLCIKRNMTKHLYLILYYL